MKKVIRIIIIVICIILCVWFAYVKYTENKLSKDENHVLLMDGERTQEEREDAEWEIIRSTIKDDLENRKEIQEICIYPESYSQYEETGIVEVKVTLQEGYSTNQEMEEQIRSYVLAITNCKQTIINVGD